MKEGQFNRELTKKLNEHPSRYAQKIADRFTPGIPDIYITGGHWIESKIVKAREHRDILSMLTGNQRTMAAHLCLHGDKVLIVSFWDLYKKVLVLPFPYLLRHPMWTTAQVSRYGFDLGKGVHRHEYVSKIFTTDGHGEATLTPQWAIHFGNQKSDNDVQAAING